MGYFLFTHEREFLFPISGDQSNYVCVSSEAGSAGAKTVGNDHIHMFLLQFFPGIPEHVFCLHGETAQELTVGFVLAEKF